jgi:hypothetical protein
MTGVLKPVLESAKHRKMDKYTTLLIFLTERNLLFSQNFTGVNRTKRSKVATSYRKDSFFPCHEHLLQ